MQLGGGAVAYRSRDGGAVCNAVISSLHGLTSANFLASGRYSLPTVDGCCTCTAAFDRASVADFYSRRR